MDLKKKPTPPNKTSDYWTIVIDAPINEKNPNATGEAKEFLTTVLTTLNNSTIYPFIASIIHDRDIKPTGELKTIHAHCFIDTPTKPTKKELLDTLSELLNVDRNLITIEATNNEFLQVQYLIHKNDQMKAQYEASEIITNNENELLKRLATTYESNDPTQALFVNKTLTDLINDKGLDFAKKYLPIFNQIKKEQAQAHTEITIREELGEFYYYYDIIELNLTNLIEEILKTIPKELLSKSINEKIKAINEALSKIHEHRSNFEETFYLSIK